MLSISVSSDTINDALLPSSSSSSSSSSFPTGLRTSMATAAAAVVVVVVDEEPVAPYDDFVIVVAASTAAAMLLSFFCVSNHPSPLSLEWTSLSPTYTSKCPVMFSAESGRCKQEMPEKVFSKYF